MADITDLTKDFKDVLEWKHFSSAQQHAIVQLTKKLDKLERENEDLRKLLESQTPLLNEKGELSIFQDKAIELSSQGMSSAEIICHLEINKLKEISMKATLSTEEIRNLESLVRSMKSMQDRPKSSKLVEDIKTQDLLHLIEGSGIEPK